MKRLANWVTAYRYELIAVLNGAIIMVLEMVGARIIAPQFGSSVYVWTAVIGVILGALSLGYWYGGKLADRVASDRVLSVILTVSAAVLLLALMTRDLSLAWASIMPGDIRFKALVAALLLFGPVNVLMGMVSPYLAKLKIGSLDTAGSSVGRLYAAGTLGSIIGTFAAGYWLISLLGNRMLGLWLVVGLAVASLMAARRGRLWLRVGVAVVALALMLLPSFEQTAWGSGRVIYDGDSAYTRWQVVDMPQNGRPARLVTGDWNVAQSGIYLDNPSEPLFDYAKAFLKVAEVHGSPKRVLLIGGGAYTLPQMLLERYPEARVDVVEIDPKLDELAGKYFGLKPDSRLRIFHEDGRTYLNKTQEKYDLVLMDAFSSMVPPFHLTTTEAVGHIARSLTPDGVVAVNIIASRTGDDARFAQAEFATYAQHFGATTLIPAVAGAPEDLKQNLVLVASREDRQIQAVAQALGVEDMQKPAEGPVLTDDFAPVEQMTAIH